MLPSPVGPSRRSALRPVLALIALAALTAVAVAACGSSSNGGGDSGGGGGDGEGHYKIALIQSYTGNDWQSSAANLIEATAATSPYAESVELDHQIAGTDPQKQSKLIEEEVSSGADALV